MPMPNICDIHKETIGKYLRDNGLTKDLDGLRSLSDYRNTWHERVIREEVKQAAKDGKTKLQFPTGETAMKIEGLGNRETWAEVFTDARGEYRDPLLPDRMKVGLEVSPLRQGVNTTGEKWIITDVLGDGKFKAVQMHELDMLSEDLAEIGLMGPDDVAKALAEGRKDVKKMIYERVSTEQFDISGKIDTENPIYQFYDKRVRKYLMNKYGAKEITDPQGVKWMEIDIKPEMGKLPVEAFGVGLIGTAGLNPDILKED